MTGGSAEPGSLVAVRLPAARFVEVTSAGHNVHRTHPATIADAITTLMG